MPLEKRHQRRYAKAVRALSARLRAARVAQQLSQEHVAEAAGIAVQTYRRLERGRPGQMNPTVDTVLRVMCVLDLHLQDLVGFESLDSGRAVPRSTAGSGMASSGA